LASSLASPSGKEWGIVQKLMSKVLPAFEALTRGGGEAYSVVLILSQGYCSGTIKVITKEESIKYLYISPPSPTD
jgi:hypothetical protein